MKNHELNQHDMMRIKKINATQNDEKERKKNKKHQQKENERNIGKLTFIQVRVEVM